MTTGTSASATGWYMSSNATLTFTHTFKNTPSVIFQEDGGNGERFYRYRTVGIASTTSVYVALIANAPSYKPNRGTYIAIGK